MPQVTYNILITGFAHSQIIQIDFNIANTSINLPHSWEITCFETPAGICLIGVVDPFTDKVDFAIRDITESVNQIIAELWNIRRFK